MVSFEEIYSVILFTEARCFPLFRPRLKDRSRMAQNDSGLCGIIAIGNIFSFEGGLCLIASHVTTLHCPFFPSRLPPVRVVTSPLEALLVHVDIS